VLKVWKGRRTTALWDEGKEAGLSHESTEKRSKDVPRLARFNLRAVWREWATGDPPSCLEWVQYGTVCSGWNGKQGQQQAMDAGGKCSCRSLDGAQLPDRARGLQQPVAIA
jgi:hypothetical protein